MSALANEMVKRDRMRNEANVMNARVAKRKGKPVQIRQWANGATMVHYGDNSWCAIEIEIWETL